MRTIALLLFAAFLVPVSASCGSAGHRPEDSFGEQIRAFHMHMRWGRYREASSFVEEPDREEFVGYYDELGDDFQVTEYEIESVDYDGDESSAVLTVWIQSFRLPSTRVDEHTYEELWVYSEERRVWELTERTEIE